MTDSAAGTGVTRNRGRCALYAAVVAGALFLWTAGASARVVISEVMFNPDGNENAREFVELHNTGDAPVSLEGCRIGDGTAFDDLVTVDGGGCVVLPGGFALVFDPDYFDSGEFYDGIPAQTVLLTVTDSAIGQRGLSNSTPERVALVSASGDTLSAVTYDISCPAGQSWERILSDDSADFAPSLAPGGTPGRPNSVTPAQRDFALASDLVTWSPESPAMGGDVYISVRVKNTGREDAIPAPVDIVMLPETLLGHLSFDTPVAPGSISETRECSVSVIPGGRLTFECRLDNAPGNAADDTVRVVIDAAIPSGTVFLSEIMAAPADGPEWLEVANTAVFPVSLDGWRIRDGGGSVSDPAGNDAFTGAGEFVLIASDTPADAGGALWIVPGRFPALNNDGDSVVLLDHTRTQIDSMSYVTAERGVSFERISAAATGNGAWGYSANQSGATPGLRNSIAFDAESTTGIELTAAPNPFAGKTTISYKLDFPLARVTLAVYDRRGRLIERLLDSTESGSERTVEWDARVDGSSLPAGPYILTLEALDRRTGRVVTERMMIVVGSRL